jgi:AcrR family transcriptional regulator
MGAPVASKRNATSTKASILDAARECFFDRGYDASIREIGSRAGVDPALVIRYFGSKEKLFLESLNNDFKIMDHWPEELEEAGEKLANQIVTPREDDECYQTLIIVLRSASNETAASLVKEKLQSEVIDPIAQKIAGTNRELRAGVIASLLIGLAFVKDVVKAEGICISSPMEQQKIYGDLIQRCVAVDQTRIPTH